MDFSDLKMGSIILHEDHPYIITKCDFLRKQQRKPVKKCVLKNIINGKTLEYSFKSGETIEKADLRNDPATFLYEANGQLHFMLSKTFETVSLPKEALGEKAGYLKENLEVQIMYFNDAPVACELPIKVQYLVTKSEPAVRGNTTTNVFKLVEIETGKEVRVPMFINEGTNIIINTETDEYVGKVD